MAVASMTGFARASGSHGDLGWTWEIRSVNGRNLDLRCRLPGGYESLEPPIRDAVARYCRRGHVNVQLQLVRGVSETRLQVNEAALEQVLQVIENLRQRMEAPAPRLEGILALRGILEPTDAVEDEESRAARDAALLAGLERALAELIAARFGEGSRIAEAVSAHLDEVELLTDEAARCASAQPEALRARLAEQVALLLDASPALPEERLAHEAALLAAKADVREELDRLQAHIAAARELLAGEEPAGRRLDFLAQEFNREANTLCAKSSDVALTRIGLDLKAAIDRIREQVQNIE